MTPEWLSTIINGSFIIILLSTLMVIIRLIRGPSLADRVVALDLMSVLAVCLIVLFTIATHQPLYIDIAIAVALLSFVGTLAFARFLEWKGDQNITRGQNKTSKENRL